MQTTKLLIKRKGFVYNISQKILRQKEKLLGSQARCCEIRSNIASEPEVVHSILSETRASFGITKEVSRRTLYHPEILKIDSYLQDREALQSRLGGHKEKFFSRLKAQIDGQKHIFTDDYKTLLLLADDQELIDLSFEVYDIYKEQQQKSAFPSLVKYGYTVLQMLYINNQVQTAFEWFYDNDKAMVRQVCRNLECFLLMLDMLYKAGRFGDILTLASTFDEYLPKSNWMLTVVHLGALYHIGTSNALIDVQAILNQHVITESPLPYRCLLFSAMLAYKQEEYAMMLEMLELPIFQNIVNKVNGKGTNLALLAYINLDRLDDAVMALKSVLPSAIKRSPIIFPCVSVLPSAIKSSPIIFPCVLQKVKDAVMKCDDIELKSTFTVVEQALFRGKFVRDRDLDRHISSYIGKKEMINAKYIFKSKQSYRGFSDNMVYQPHR